MGALFYVERAAAALCSLSLCQEKSSVFLSVVFVVRDFCFTRVGGVRKLLIFVECCVRKLNLRTRLELGVE